MDSLYWLVKEVLNYTCILYHVTLGSTFLLSHISLVFPESKTHSNVAVGCKINLTAAEMWT